MYPDFPVGPLTFHTFGLMMALGFVAASTVVYFELKRKGLNPECVYWLDDRRRRWRPARQQDPLSAAAPGRAKSDPLSSAFSGAGLVWYGGLIGGTSAAMIVIRIYRLPWGKAFDAGAPALAIGYAFGRMGCFLNGDDYGRPSDLPWAMEFRDGSPPTPSASESSRLSSTSLFRPC